MNATITYHKSKKIGLLEFDKKLHRAMHTTKIVSRLYEYQSVPKGVVRCKQ